MKHDTYWRKRAEQQQEALLSKGDSYLIDLDREFKKAMLQAERDLAVWYQRLADNNGITLQQAKRWLTDSELEEFRWTVEEYIKAGQDNAFDQRWMKELENASARVHISRLEAIKLQLQQQAELLYGNHLDNTDSLLRDIYTEGYYHTAFSIQQGFNVGWSLTAINTDQIDKVLSKPWTADGSNFSAKIWRDRDKLVNELHTRLTQMIIRGEAPDRTIREIAKQFSVSRMRAATLVQTEAAYFASAAQGDCYKELGIDFYEVVETLDSLTCSVCSELDGKVFQLSDYEASVTSPPFHPRCRGTTAPYFHDELTEGEMRAARNEDGETYYVPGDMAYPEWKEKYAHKVLGKGRSGKSGISSGGYVDTIPRKEIDETIRKWENKIRNLENENMVVVTPDGKIYHFLGDSENVFSQGVLLDDAIITHNHPGDEITSFGGDDFAFLKANPRIKELRAVNSKFDYHIKLLKPFSDISYSEIYNDALRFMESFEDDIQHCAMLALQERGYVEYARQKIE